MAQPSEDAIREQAYYLWEQDGRPFGRDIEYWQRAMSLATPKPDAVTPAKPAKAKSKARAPEPKATVKGKAAATQSKTPSAKSVKAAAKKPKKK